MCELNHSANQTLQYIQAYIHTQLSSYSTAQMIPHTQQTRTANSLDCTLSSFIPEHGSKESLASPPSDAHELWNLSVKTVTCERTSIMHEFYKSSCYYIRYNSQRPLILKLKHCPIYVISNLLDTTSSP